MGNTHLFFCDFHAPLVDYFLHEFHGFLAHEFYLSFLIKIVFFQDLFHDSGVLFGALFRHFRKKLSLQQSALDLLRCQIAFPPDIVYHLSVSNLQWLHNRLLNWFLYGLHFLFTNTLIYMPFLCTLLWSISLNTW